ncbi:protein unc-50 homolog isoform X2 [Corticium candelabrum]|uniref:protein unc-50 homolog isoform X2 n=1 Tax=Corticium candelabrum TaxID=121492 RepID=UPI002E25D60E|nr:protein unc-50 homolog isoform X2 [Corticium candelabrum]
MLPSQNGVTTSRMRRSRSSRRFDYFRRMLKWRHMDFEFALWQMFYLCADPSRVYKNFRYHKQTKNIWARDDPAFLVLLAAWLCGSSIFYTVVCSFSFEGFIYFLLWTVFVECIGIGLVVASILWYLTNRFGKADPNDSQQVEWAYAFDIHLNAYFPTLIILHMVQVFLLHKSIHSTVTVLFLGNALWLMALSYYSYITFLGYSSLAFLKKTVLFLYAIPLFFLLYIVAALLGLSCSSLARDFYTELAK